MGDTMVARNVGLTYFLKNKVTRIASLGGIIVLLISSWIVNTGLSAPVIVTGDSEGSWTDSFEDEKGLEEKNDVVINSGEITLGSGGAFDPQNWTKQGLAVDIGSGNDYDTIYTQHPSVMMDEGIYKMWYSGWNGSNTRILYATSIDGIVWNKQGLVLDLGAPGALDDYGVAIPQVIKDGTLFRMWYNGNDGANDRVFYANSTDGVNWNKQGMVMDIGSTGQLDDESARPYHLLKENGEYKLWYGGFDGSNYRMLYANSTDGLSWTKQGIAINLGSPGSLDDMHIGGGSVMNDNGIYRMWYSGHDGSTYRILYADSNDGLSWTKHGLALDKGSAGEFDDNQLAYPMVLKDIDWFYKMWYQGNDGSNSRIMLATSSYIPIEGNLTSINISIPI